MHKAIILKLYNVDVSSKVSSACVTTHRLFFSNMKGAVSITIWFVTAFSCMKYVQIKFHFSKK